MCQMKDYYYSISIYNDIMAYLTMKIKLVLWKFWTFNKIVLKYSDTVPIKIFEKLKKYVLLKYRNKNLLKILTK